MKLEHLFDLEGVYRKDEGTGLTPYGVDEHVWYGFGSGQLEGPRLSGRMNWLNHERSREDGVWLVHIHGKIEGADGARILVRVEGLTVSCSDGVQHRSMTAWTFQTDAEQHRWLNATLGVGEWAIGEASDDYPLRARVFAAVADL